MMKILTPSGFQPFEGIAKHEHCEYLKFHCSDSSVLRTALLHRFVLNNKEVFAKDISVGTKLSPTKTIKKIEKVKKPIFLYDPLNVENGKLYFHDVDIVSHNSFLGTGNTLIDGNVIMGMVGVEPQLITSEEVFIYQLPKPGHIYILAADVAQGRSLDYSTFSIIDITNAHTHYSTLNKNEIENIEEWEVDRVSTHFFEQVATYRNNLVSPLVYPSIIAKFARQYNNAFVLVENNDIGNIVCNALYYDLEYEQMYVNSGSSKAGIGVRNDKRVKRIGCSTLKDIIEQYKLKIVDRDTINEFATYCVQGSSWGATDGNNDDTISALVLFSWFTSTDDFENIFDILFKNVVYEQTLRDIEEAPLPFGFVVGGLNGSLGDSELKDALGIGGAWEIVPRAG